MAHGHPVSKRTYDYRAIVDKKDPKRKEPTKGVYRFSNGRKFNEKRDPYS